jgi:hypothetical protein
VAPNLRYSLAQRLPALAKVPPCEYLASVIMAAVHASAARFGVVDLRNSAGVASPRRSHAQVSFDFDLIGDDEASW